VIIFQKFFIFGPLSKFNNTYKMNRTGFTKVLALLILVLAGCQQKEEPLRIFDRKYLKVIRDARQEAYFYQVRNFMPGSSVAVSIDGRLVWSEGFGQASAELEVPATRHTKYRMGQITQVITALAYYRMVEEGLVNPDDDIRKLLPAFPEKKYTLKLQNLVDQTSGIRPPSTEELFWRGLNVPMEQALENFWNDTLLFQPGMYQYPTLYSYNLLGTALTKAAGKNFSLLVSEWVTDTLDMKNTVPDNPLVTVKGRSDFFDRNLVAQTINAVTLDLRYRLPSDGYLSTAEDLVKLGNALLSSPLLSDSVRHRMLTPPLINNEMKANQGNGLLFFKDAEGKLIYASKGNVTGSGALLLIFPDEKMVVACMSNLSDEGEELPGLKIADMFRDFLTGNYGKAAETVKETDQQENKDPGKAE
jgi:CubicO group peptidase (beta-lactamase class C family)